MSGNFAQLSGSLGLKMTFD